jgi:plastocyanin
MKKTIPFQKVATGLAASLLALLAPFSQAATTNVTIVGDSFSPVIVNIHVGDTVAWTGGAGFHTVTGSTVADRSQFCGSGTITTCSETFNSAGSFPYACLVHSNCCSMTGLVVVVVVPPSPTVSITNPAVGAVYSAPAVLHLGAAAAVSSGTVTNVAFFAGATPLGSVQVSPFNITSSSLAAGNYSLTAVATAAGLSTTSAVVNVSVVSPVAVSNSVPVVASSHFSFNYSADVGLTYVIQRSNDLINWTPVLTNVASTTSVHFADTTLVGAAGYYRVVLQPNP